MNPSKWLNTLKTLKIRVWCTTALFMTIDVHRKIYHTLLTRSNAHVPCESRNFKYIVGALSHRSLAYTPIGDCRNDSLKFKANFSLCMDVPQARAPAKIFSRAHSCCKDQITALNLHRMTRCWRGAHKLSPAKIYFNRLGLILDRKLP